jgi:hypothetical protein
MKKRNVIRVFALAALLVAGSALGSYAEKPAILPAKDIHATLSECIKFPPSKAGVDVRGTADVVFIIDNGQIIVKSIKTENKDLADYLRSSMGKVCCKNIKSPMNQHYAVRFTFRLV